MHPRLLPGLLPLPLLLAACASAPGRPAGSESPGYYEVEGHSPTDTTPSLHQAEKTLPFVAVGEEDVVGALRDACLFTGYRIVPKEPERHVQPTQREYPRTYMASAATRLGVTRAASPALLRPGELLVDLIVEPAYGEVDFDVRFDLNVVDRDGTAVVATQTVFLRCIQVGGEVSYADFPAVLSAGMARAREVALVKLVNRLLDDELSIAALNALPASARAAPPQPAAPAPRPPRLPAPRAPKGRTFVLAVGVDDYADPAISDLRSAENDAHDLAAFYALHRRSPAGPERVVTLAGKAATRTAVLQAVREHLGQATDPDDAVVLFFAGHGFSDANDAYLAPQDAELTRLPETAIALSALQTYWARLGATSKLLLVDACHAGALAGLRGVGGIARPKEDPAATRPLGETTVVVAGSSAEQLSAEHAPHARGVFTTALLHGLSGDADQNGDRVITLAELRAYLDAEVPRRARIAGARQTPVVVAPAGSDGMALTR